MITRLFDIVDQRQKKQPNSVLLASKIGGHWKTISSQEVWNTAQWLSGGISSLGISTDFSSPETQEKIAIISPNRPEWVMTDLAVQLCGAVLTPIYPTINPLELGGILQEAEVKIVFLANQELYDRFKDCFQQNENIKHIYSFDEVAGIPKWTSLLEKQIKPNPSLIEKITEHTLATIIYTSGTTGAPKGVMLTHRNIVSNIQNSMPAFTFAEDGAKALSFLPLNHIFEKMVTYLYVEAGISIYYAESMETIGENLREVQPIVFSTVPRLLEKVYEKILSKAVDFKGIKRALFFWALELGKRYDIQDQGSAWYRIQLSIANVLVFSKWRAALGGNVKAIVSGSAACQDRLVRIFTAAKLVVMEGYGLTETSPVVTVNRFEADGRMVGTIGKLIQNVEVKLAEDGEILTKGPNVMLGYYKKPEMTAEVLKDGWLYTGDIGTWLDNGFLKITDRKKEMFKTSGGKYVAPQVIENKMKESPFIEQIMIIGADKKYVSALIVPNFKALKNYLKHHRASDAGTNQELIQRKEVLTLLQQQVDKLNKDVNKVEQIKKFTLLPKEWTVDSGELTPSLKVKRKVILQKHEQDIASMYDDVAI